MQSSEAVFHTPIVLQGLCYLSGMSVALSSYFWLWRRARGHDNIFKLRQICGVWLVRVITFCAAASLAGTYYQGRQMAAQTLPEFSILFLTLALYLLVEKRRYKDTLYILKNRLPMEIVKTAGVALLSAAAFGFSLGLGWLGFQASTAAHGPDWIPAFVVGLLWVLPLPYLISVIRANGLEEGERYSGMVWPLIFAILLIMIPDFIEHLANSPKINEFTHARPRLQRA